MLKASALFLNAVKSKPNNLVDFFLFPSSVTPLYSFSSNQDKTSPFPSTWSWYPRPTYCGCKAHSYHLIHHRLYCTVAIDPGKPFTIIPCSLHPLSTTTETQRTFWSRKLAVISPCWKPLISFSRYLRTPKQQLMSHGWLLTHVVWPTELITMLYC